MIAKVTGFASLQVNVTCTVQIISVAKMIRIFWEETGAMR